MRGIIKTELKDFNSAIADFNRAIAINPKDASAYSMRACTKLEMGDLDGASKDLQIANKLYDEGEK
jgi:Flp pilus assembly protein TadD